MVKKLLHITIALVGAMFGLYVGSFAVNGFLSELGSNVYVKMGIVGVATLIGLVIGLVAAKPLCDLVINGTNWLESKLQRMPIQDLIGGAIGLIIGLIIATFIGYAFSYVPFIGAYIPVVASLSLGYIGMSVGAKKKEEIANAFSFLKISKDKTKGDRKTSSNRPKVLDTSVIIDGRIADLCKTGFVEGPLVIPNFVLEELRHIADSSDGLKRNRGRRGLDILNKIRKELDIAVQITDKDYDDIAEVDSKLVKLAQDLEGCVVTNDYNLNKVAELQGVIVLNINELANAIKPVVLPGEEMVVQVIKDGKESGQGVAYLDDGTMIVVENGRKVIGETVKVVVTSVIQTAAGRMIFAKIDHE